MGQGTGPSKQQAQQQAARTAIENYKQRTKTD
jgi:dsRNA-specific ribonuclease